MAPVTTASLVRLEHTTENTEVRDQPALLAREAGAGRVLLQWYEPSGLVVTVASAGAGEQEVRQFAESLQASNANELQRLIDGLPPWDHS